MSVRFGLRLALGISIGFQGVGFMRGFDGEVVLSYAYDFYQYCVVDEALELSLSFHHLHSLLIYLSFQSLHHPRFLMVFSDSQTVYNSHTTFEIGLGGFLSLF